MGQSDDQVMSEAEVEKIRKQSASEDESSSSSSSSESDGESHSGGSGSGAASGSGSARSGSVARSARSGSVARSARSGSVARSIRSGSVAGSARSGSVAGSARSESGSVAGSARSGSASDSSSGDDSAGEEEVNNEIEEDETDLFCSDNEDYHKATATSTLPIPRINNMNRPGRGRGKSGNANDRGPSPLSLPVHQNLGRYQGSTSGSSKFQQARRPEGLVAELKLSKNVETLSQKECPKFQQPSEIACYSRASDGKVYFDDRCLRPFRRSILEESGLYLNEGFETFVDKREDLECQGFGDMLSCIRNNKNISLANIHFVTFRNNLNKILETAYNRIDPWEMGVHRRNDTVYLDVRKLRQRPQSERDHQRTYWGYSFEHHATVVPNKGESEDSHVVDANVEYCALIKTKLGAHRIIMGAEMDCYDKSSRDGKKYYVELKTSRELEDRRTLEIFEKYKLLKYWIQSFLAGVPFIVVGFRDDDGRLLRCKRFATEEIRKSVKDKMYWQGGVCLAFADEVLCWLYGTVKDDQDYILQFVPSLNRIELVQSNLCPSIITSHVDQLNSITEQL